VATGDIGGNHRSTRILGRRRPLRHSGRTTGRPDTAAELGGFAAIDADAFQRPQLFCRMSRVDMMLERFDSK